MNTYTMYDLDTLVFSQGASTTTPPPENDWVWIEANTGTSGSPNLTGMHYNVPSSKTHQFKINGTEVFAINNDKIEFSSGQEISHDSGGLTFNVPTGDKHYWQVNDQTKIYFDTDQLYLANGTSLKINDNYVEFGDLSSSPSNPSSNRARLFLNASDVLTIRKSDGTEVNLESSGGVALGDSPTWTGVHTFQNHVNIGNNYSQDNLTITSKIKGSTIPVDTNWGDNSQDNIDDTLFIDANLDMNTWNIYDLDSLYFSTNASSTNPAHETDSYSIDAIDTSTNESLNFYTKSGKDFKWYEGGVSSEVLKYDGGDNEWRFMHVINMNNNKIENVADPVANKDVVNKQYADANYSGGGGGVNSNYIWTSDETNEYDEMVFVSNATYGATGGLGGIKCRMYQNYIYYIPIYFSKACTINEFGFEMTGGGSGSVGFRYGLYSNRTDGQNYPHQLIDGGDQTKYLGSGIGAVRTGTLSGSYALSVPSSGLYWFAVNNQNNTSAFTVEAGNSGGQITTVGHVLDTSTSPDHYTPIQGFKENDSGTMPSTADDDNEALGYGNYSSGQTAPIVFLRVS